MKSLADKESWWKRPVWLAKDEELFKHLTLNPNGVEDDAKENAGVDTVTEKQKFGLELAVLQVGRDLPKASVIRDLNPFLAEGEGLLRIQTSFRNAVYPEGIKHPIQLRGDHIATELIATGLRLKLLHAGVATTIAELREHFA
ncbi:hypothetical protein HPB51_028006 [Rhipicephalus microplus]|uniref:Uncharacterized protein n=1 Tax=Rhipicephalus microplus TaxID=6941 RepID=A0A9J6CYI8_RHIMP|nr:hypothetical protein HPB51_028006 [Rhipicephalus microplus]